MRSVILVREAKTIVRHRWVAALLLLPLVLFSLLIAVRWPSAGEVDLAGVRGTQVFQLFAYTLLGTLLLLAPAYPAASLVSERRRGTLALLLNTPLDNRSIYLGKLGAAVLYTLVPLVMSLPVAAACYTLGAIELLGQFVPLYAVLTLVAVEYAVIALWISCRAGSPVAAMRLSYLAVLGLACLSTLPYWFTIRGGGEASRAAIWLRSASPIPAVMEISGHADVWGGGVAVEAGAPWRYAATTAVISLLLATLTVRSIRPTMLERSRAAGRITDDLSRSVQRVRRLFYLLDPQRRTRGIADWMNPVLVKEFRSRRFGRGPWVMRMIAASAVVSLAMTYAATTGAIGWRTETIGGVLVVLQVALIVIVAPSLASGLISDELESHGWSLLQMTPLSTTQIVAGKLLSVTWTVLLLLLATLPGYAVMMLIKPVMTQQVIAVLGTLVLTAAFTILLGGALSGVLLQTTKATIAAYGTLIVLFGGTLAIWLGRGAPFGPQTVETALAFNPIAAALSLIEAPGFESYHLVPECWYLLGGASLLCLLVLGWRTHTLAKPS